MDCLGRARRQFLKARLGERSAEWRRPGVDKDTGFSFEGCSPYAIPTFSRGRDARFVKIFQRSLSLEPFEQEESMGPECPQ